MCAAKSPISALQEYTMQKNLPFPHYDTMQQGTGFKCIVTVGIIKKLAIAESKKRAKHLCAEQALAVLQPFSPSTTVVDSFSEPQCTIRATIRVTVDEDPNFNAVGKLNELCSQNGRSFPSYAELGCIDQKFGIQCSLLSHVTQGRASTKKQAKQKAAKEMLNRVQVSDFHIQLVKDHTAECKRASHNSEMEEKVVELFKQLTTSKKQDPEIRRDPFAIFQDDPLVDKFKNNDNQGTKQSIEILSEMELREELARLNVHYKISTYQVQPLILVLKASLINGSTHTFLQSGDSYNAIVLSLLKQAVEGIAIMTK